MSRWKKATVTLAAAACLMAALLPASSAADNLALALTPEKTVVETVSSADAPDETMIEQIRTTYAAAKKRARVKSFRGKCGKTTFALAHNGILCNDRTLRRELKLPLSKIETDSYIAVQLLESKKRFDFESIKYMAEKVEGSFSFSLLDDHDNLYLVKGDSPLAIFHFSSKAAYSRSPSLSAKASSYSSSYTSEIRLKKRIGVT